ncbi:MAG: hypothetical protein IPJ41_06385 [Phycisphaerales bacterium]|nr:hypothetical protein [Phycisphaerales bacterium]
MLALLIATLQLAAAAAGLWLLPTPEASAQPELPPASPRVQPDPVEPPTPLPIENTDELLTALEHAGDNIHELSADVRYVKEFSIQGDTQIREGRLAFESKPDESEGGPPARRFALDFNKLIVGGRVEDSDTRFREQYIFDGEWLAEIHPIDKEFVRRQVVPPGERWDPLKIGEGPFPIPIQQKRDEILSRFDAALVDSQEAVDDRPLVGIAGKCYQLKLTPRADAGDSDLKEIRIWYEKDTLLPRIARTVNNAGDVSLVLLKNLKLNGDADIGEAELSTQPPADLAGWNYTQQDYRADQ